MTISPENETEKQPEAKTAVIAVDVQRDFRPGGALAVKDGDAVIAPLLEAAQTADYLVVTGDQHPEETAHFDNWPVHCVQGTPGAEIDPALLAEADVVIAKGMSNADDGYSAFEGTTPDGQPLADWLRAAGVNKVLVGGLATDYCVRATVLDAVKEGFETTLLAFAARGVDINAGDSARAIEEMATAGAQVSAAAERPFLNSKLDLAGAEEVEL